MDSNPGPLALEGKGLPTVPQLCKGAFKHVRFQSISRLAIETIRFSTHDTNFTAKEQ